jgi:hypothetical protein
MDILLGLVLGVVILAGVAFFALRASDKPMRTRDSRYDYEAPFIGGDHGGPGANSG